MSQHTCRETGRSGCAVCMEFEVDLWEAINRYATSVGGDPSQHVHGNVPRMQAVVDVGKVVAKLTSQQQLDDLTIKELVKGHDAAAAYACRMSELRAIARELSRLWYVERQVPEELIARLEQTIDPPQIDPPEVPPARDADLQTRAAVEVIRGIVARLPDEATRVSVLDQVLENRCRKCLDYSPSGSFWCCYDSRGG